MIDRVPGYVWKIFLLLLWGGLIIGFKLVRFDNIGIDEGAAMALLLNWSVSDQIVNPVTTYGGPDFRALLFIPLGIYWPGSIIAAKVFTLLFTFAAALQLYKWSNNSEDSETALIATGLFLISPGLIYLIDSISIAPFLLAMFAFGLYLDRKYRESEHIISSRYFLQMLAVAITVTLHPMGLAYPIALAWMWYQNPKAERQKKQVWTGLAITVLIMFAIQAGWISISWFSNPLNTLHYAVMGVDKSDPYAEHWIIGVVLLSIAAYLIFRDFKKLTNDLMGTTLLAAFILGFVAADLNWAIVVLVLILYRGIPALIQINKSIKANSFVGQRGIVMAVMMAVAVLFMQADKRHALQIAQNILTPKEFLISRLAEEAADPDKPFLAASQWPAQTMIVCKREVFKLPPAQENSTQLKANIKNITHLMFNHKDPENLALARNISELGGYTETVVRQPQGVIVKIRGQQITDKQIENSQSEHLPEKNQKDKID